MDGLNGNMTMPMPMPMANAPVMGGMASLSPSPSPMNSSSGMNKDMEMAMSHMTFFWSKNNYILFSGWPGTSGGMYALALILVFVLSILVEWLSQCQLMKPGSKNVVAGVMQTVLHCLRIGLAYLVMLAVMSFNGGVFLVAVVGHTLGFFLFRSRVFKEPDQGNSHDVHPTDC